jgi:hypothetical protein
MTLIRSIAFGTEIKKSRFQEEALVFPKKLTLPPNSALPPTKCEDYSKPEVVDFGLKY